MCRNRMRVTKNFAGIWYDEYSVKIFGGRTIILNMEKECDIYGDIR